MRNKSRSSTPSPNRLRLCNNVLSGIVLLLAVYIIAGPFLPNVQFRISKIAGSTDPLVRANTSVRESEASPREQIPKENTLVIPALGIREIIYEGNSASVLRKGIWHRPNTSVPADDSNTVLAGHRFTYSNPKGVFYHLDKVDTDDVVVLYWQGKKYIYQVNKVSVVKPSAIEVEQASEEPMLTMYTCTPLWSGKERLVVQAKLVEAQ